MIVNFKNLLLILTAIIISSVFGCTSEPSVDPQKTSEKAQSILMENLQTGSQTTRATIVEMTSGLESDQALPILKIALEDRQKKIAEKALMRIIFIKDPSTIDIIRNELGDKFDSELLKILIELGADDLDENIAKGLRSLMPNERSAAVEILGLYKGEEAKEQQRKHLEDEEIIVRIKAKLALGRIGDMSALEDLGDMLDDEDLLTRAGAVAIIDELDLKDYRDQLLDIATNDKRLVGSEALRVLYEWGDPDAREILKERITYTDAFSLYTLVEMIEKSKDVEMVDTLKQLMASASSSERYSAAMVISIIDRENNPEALKFMLDGMDSDIPVVREKVAESLGNLAGVSEAKDILEKKGLADEDIKTKLQSIESLGKIGDRDTLKKLAPLLDDANFQIKASASIAVLNIVSRMNRSKN